MLFDNQLWLTRISGFLVFAMGLFLLGSITTSDPRFYQEARFHPDFGRFGRAAPPVAGAAFGFGVLLMTNQLIRITTELQNLLRAIGLEWIVNLG